MTTASLDIQVSTEQIAALEASVKSLISTLSSLNGELAQTSSESEDAAKSADDLDDSISKVNSGSKSADTSMASMRKTVIGLAAGFVTAEIAKKAFSAALRIGTEAIKAFGAANVEAGLGLATLAEGFSGAQAALGGLIIGGEQGEAIMATLYNVTQILTDTIKENEGALKEVVANGFSVLLNVMQGVVRGVAIAINTFNVMRLAFLSIKEAVTQAALGLTMLGTLIVRGILGAVRLLITGLSSLLGAFASLAEFVPGFGDEISNAYLRIQEFTDGLGDGIGQVEGFFAAFQNDLVDQQAQSLQDYRDALADITNSMVAVDSAADRMNSQIEDLNEAFKNGEVDADAYNASLERIRESQNNNDDAARDSAEAINSLRAAFARFAQQASVSQEMEFSEGLISASEDIRALVDTFFEDESMLSNISGLMSEDIRNMLSEATVRGLQGRAEFLQEIFDDLSAVDVSLLPEEQAAVITQQLQDISSQLITTEQDMRVAAYSGMSAMSEEAGRLTSALDELEGSSDISRAIATTYEISKLASEAFQELALNLGEGNYTALLAEELDSILQLLERAESITDDVAEANTDSVREIMNFMGELEKARETMESPFEFGLSNFQELRDAVEWMNSDSVDIPKIFGSEEGREKILGQMDAIKDRITDLKSNAIDAAKQMGLGFADAFGGLLATGDLEEFKKASMKILGEMIKSLGMVAIQAGIVKTLGDPAAGFMPNPVVGGAMIAAGGAALVLGSALGASGGGGGGSKTTVPSMNNQTENRTMNIYNQISPFSDPRATAQEISRVVKNGERSGI